MLKRTYRLFISSTFSDFKREREVLQTQVFPEIKAYCAERGYKFQPIDLRWGVNHEAQLDQKTLQLCLNEVRACKTHPHPNFLIMIGDRYGWTPLPYAIEKQEFETLLDLIDPEQKATVLSWYQEDLNQLPTSYILRRRTEAHIEQSVWQEVENTLLTILRASVKEALNKSLISEEQQRKYVLSATEAEVEEGIIPYLKPTPFQKTLIEQQPELSSIDPEHIFGLFRDIDKETSKNGPFIGDDYAQAQDFKARAKVELKTENIHQIQTRQLDKDHLDESYLDGYAEKVIQFLKKQLDDHQKQEKELTPLEIETEAQGYFASQKRQHFIGQEESLNRITQYLNANDEQPLVLYGPSGRGKSALMAKAIEQAEGATDRQICYRFIGATPHSGASKQILISLFDELGQDVREDANSPAGSKEPTVLEIENIEQKESFEAFSYRIHDAITNIDRPVVLFIDAVDQLGNEDQFLWLPRALPGNVKIVLSALEDDNYKEDSKKLQILKKQSSNTHEIPPFHEPERLLLSLLKEEQRILQPHQRDYFLKQFQASQSPLYVTVAVEEVKHWASADAVASQPHPPGTACADLADSQRGIIEEFIRNLSSLYHHEQKLVQRVLGYLYASRDGLSETELLELLATDEGFIEEIAPETFHKNVTRDLPTVIWTRLHAQLAPFLSKKSQDGEELLYFFHREFGDVIRALPSQQKQHEAIIKAAQCKILQHQHNGFDANRWGRLYVILITRYELQYRDKEKQRQYAEFVSTLEHDFWIESCLIYTNGIGREHQDLNRTAEAASYLEAMRFASKVLYGTHSDRWVGYYTEALNNLALSYNSVERTLEAIALAEENLTILEALYGAHPDEWAERYTTALNVLASSYQRVDRTSEAITLEEESLTILKALYGTHPDRWVEGYTTVLNNLAEYYRSVDRTSEAITLEEESLTILKALYGAHPDRWAERYALALDNLASSYNSVERTPEAIALQEESLTIRKSFYGAHPDRWAEGYTTGLNNLADSYNSVERTLEAIALGEENLTILKALYGAHPDRWARGYTLALSNLAPSYNSVERTPEAIALEEESLTIRKTLYGAHPDRWAEDYTIALNNLALSYVKVDRISEAITLGEESLTILKALYVAQPDRWAKGYATVLVSLAGFYISVDRIPEAITLQEESLTIRKTLYGAHPDRWAEGYTTVLSNLALSYNSVERAPEAIALEEESLTILKALYGAHSDRWAEDYTIALNNLALSYVKVDRISEAITLGEESLTILKALYVAQPDRWAKGYATVLVSLAGFYISVDRTPEAITLQEESLTIRKTLYGAHPDRWAKGYTTVLNNLAESYKRVNRTSEAIALEKESLTILKALYGAHPDRWAENYSRALNNLALSYNSVERAPEAIALEEESLTILKALYGAHPERWAEKYTLMLNNLAEFYKRVNRASEAIALGKESLTILKALYGSHPDRWAEEYTRALNNLALSYNSVERAPEAIALEEESLTILKALYGAHSDRWAEDYTIALNNLAEYYRSIDRTSEAITLGEESLTILKPLYAAHPDRWAENCFTALNNLALSYVKVDRISEAITLGEESLTIVKPLYAAHPDRWAENYILALNNLAVSNYKVGRVDEVLSLLEERLIVSISRYGEEHEKSIAIAKNIQQLRAVTTKSLLMDTFRVVSSLYKKMISGFKSIFFK